MPPTKERSKLWGWCRFCSYRWRLRKDGRLMSHTLYDAFGKHVCAGTGTEPNPRCPS